LPPSTPVTVAVTAPGSTYTSGLAVFTSSVPVVSPAGMRMLPCVVTTVTSVWPGWLSVAVNTAPGSSSVTSPVLSDTVVVSMVSVICSVRLAPSKVTSSKLPPSTPVTFRLTLLGSTYTSGSAVSTISVPLVCPAGIRMSPRLVTTTTSVWPGLLSVTVKVALAVFSSTSAPPTLTVVVSTVSVICAVACAAL